MPPSWFSRHADRRSVAIDKDFSVEEIGGIYRYDFQVRIAVDGKWLTSAHLWSFNIVPMGHTMHLAKPFFCPVGSVLEVDVLPASQFHWRWNPISIYFSGQVSG